MCVYPAARVLYVEACTNDQRRAVLDAVAVNGAWAGRETDVHFTPHPKSTRYMPAAFTLPSYVHFYFSPPMSRCVQRVHVSDPVEPAVRDTERV